MHGTGCVGATRDGTSAGDMASVQMRMDRLRRVNRAARLAQYGEATGHSHDTTVPPAPFLC